MTISVQGTKSMCRTACLLGIHEWPEAGEALTSGSPQKDQLHNSSGIRLPQDPICSLVSWLLPAGVQALPVCSKPRAHLHCHARSPGMLAIKQEEPWLASPWQNK